METPVNPRGSIPQFVRYESIKTIYVLKKCENIFAQSLSDRIGCHQSLEVGLEDLLGSGHKSLAANALRQMQSVDDVVYVERRF